MLFGAELVIARYHSAEGGTFGVLLVHGEPRFVTLEPPWKGNAVGKSCIPLGEYEIGLHVSARHGVTYEVLGVPGRDEILFHAGNEVHETTGCILLGITLGFGKILNSREAMHRFVELMAGRDRARVVVVGIV